MLITSDVDGGSYELYVVPKDASGRSDTPVSSEPTTCCVITAEQGVTLRTLSVQATKGGSHGDFEQ